MREADSAIHVTSPAVPNLPELGRSGLLLAIESFLEPLVTVLSLWVLVWHFDGALSALWLTASVLAFALAFPGRSLLRLPPDRVFFSILLAWLWTAGLLLAMGFATGYISDFNSAVIVNWLWFAPASQLVVHWALRKAAPHLVRLQGPPLRAVVVGMNEQGCALADRLAGAGDTGIDLVGFFDDREPERQHGHERHRLLGRITEIAAYVKVNRIHLIYLSLPMASQPRIKELLDALKDTTASVYFVPDMFVTDLIQGRLDHIGGTPVVAVCDSPFSGVNGLIKRVDYGNLVVDLRGHTQSVRLVDLDSGWTLLDLRPTGQDVAQTAPLPVARACRRISSRSLLAAPAGMHPRELMGQLNRSIPAKPVAVTPPKPQENKPPAAAAPPRLSSGSWPAARRARPRRPRDRRP